jgi:hypothetical protein
MEPFGKIFIQFFIFNILSRTVDLDNTNTTHKVLDNLEQEQQNYTFHLIDDELQVNI